MAEIASLLFALGIPVGFAMFALAIRHGDEMSVGGSFRLAAFGLMLMAFCGVGAVTAIHFLIQRTA